MTAQTAETTIQLADGTHVPLYADGTVAVYCKRCGGCGRYSYCQRWADMCFGCEGKGIVGREPREDAERRARRRAKERDRKIREIEQAVAENERRFAEWAATRVELVEALRAVDVEEESWTFLRELADHVQRGFILTEAQEAGIRKALAKRAEQEAKRAEEAANAQPVPTGRVVVEGEILTVKEQLSDYGVTWKMLVRDDRGFRVWGTIPAALGDADKGYRVRFTARLEPKAGEETFGFFTRPTKAEILSAPERPSEPCYVSGCGGTVTDPTHKLCDKHSEEWHEANNARWAVTLHD